MRITVKIEMVIEVEENSSEQSSAMLYDARCMNCGWYKQYDTPSKARRGRAGHSVHCKGSGLNSKDLFDQLVTGKLGL